MLGLGRLIPRDEEFFTLFDELTTHLATAAQLTPRTVAKIMTRETRSPRMLTCIMLFKALGFRAVRLE